MLELEQAQALIRSDLQALASERVSLSDCANRIAAETIHAKRQLPGFDNAAMDGFAVRLKGEADTQFVVVDEVAAGQPQGAELEPGQAVRIFTGAVVPPGSDAVIMQENCELNGKSLQVNESIRSGQHIRWAGEDIAVDDTLVEPGTRFHTGHVGVLASQGIENVDVVRKPRVAILPTGNEIIPISQEPKPGQVSDSNSLMLAAQVNNVGGTATSHAPARDTFDVVKDELVRIASDSDLVISCGGVSVGDYDHVRHVLEQEGNVIFWKVAIKPGKPILYGRIANTPVLALPGNPVSAFVCFELFGTVALNALLGAPDTSKERISVDVDTSIKRNRGRREFVRAHSTLQDDKLVATPYKKQGSAHMSGLLSANVLLDIFPGPEPVPAGASVPAIVLDMSTQT